MEQVVRQQAGQPLEGARQHTENRQQDQFHVRRNHPVLPTTEAQPKVHMKPPLRTTEVQATLQVQAAATIEVHLEEAMVAVVTAAAAATAEADTAEAVRAAEDKHTKII